MKMADVFVSYKRENAAHVRKLAAALRIAGLDVWRDEHIPASAPWEATIEKELANANVLDASFALPTTTFGSPRTCQNYGLGVGENT